MLSFNHLRISLCVFALTLFLSSNLFAQDVGVPTGTTFFSTGTSGSGSGGQLGHLQTGTFGNLAGGNTWIAIGKPQIGGVGLPVYGVRIQDNGDVGLMSLNQSGADRDLQIAWGSDESAIFEIDFINDQNGVVPNTNIMTAEANGNVGFGTTNPRYRVEVINESSSPSAYAFYSENQRSGFFIGNYSRSDYISVYGNGFDDATTSVQFGVYGRSFRSNSTGTNYGLFGLAGGDGPSYGVRGSVSSSGGGTKYGVFGNASGASNFAGFFSGNLTYTGTFTHTSDRRLKDNIENEENALDRIMKLRPTTYQYKTKGQFSQMNLAEGLQHGFIAQELEEVIPEAVHETTFMMGDHDVDPEAGELPELKAFEYKAVNYMALIPILTKGIQEQQVTIDAVQAENEELKSELSELQAQMLEMRAAMGMPTNKVIDNALDAEAASVLYTNTPNPFTEATTIRYEVAENAGVAQMLVFNMNGQQIRNYDLKPGANTLTIQGSDLQAGMYLYSLIVDGQEIDTKRMILTK